MTGRTWVWAEGPNQRMPEQSAFEAPNVLLGQVRLGQVIRGYVRSKKKSQSGCAIRLAELGFGPKSQTQGCQNNRHLERPLYYQVRLGQVSLGYQGLGQVKKKRVHVLFALQKLGLGQRPKPNDATACAIRLECMRYSVRLLQVRLGQVIRGQVR